MCQARSPVGDYERCAVELVLVDFPENLVICLKNFALASMQQKVLNITTTRTLTPSTIQSQLIFALSMYAHYESVSSLITSSCLFHFFPFNQSPIFRPINSYTVSQFLHI